MSGRIAPNTSGVANGSSFVTGLVSAFIAVRMGQVQLAVAGKMLRMNANAARAAVELVDAAQKKPDRLADTAAGIGANLDISV